MIDPATIEKIKNAADIVEVVGDYVHLIRRGSNYMGLCPFHNERTPSFSVNKSRNFCYCFSCKKGGSPVNFIMEKEGLSYHEALLHLAKRYGITVEEREMTDEERERQSAREAMLVANEWAMLQMEHDLRDTEEGIDIGMSYLHERGVTDSAMKAFHLGYAIDKGDNLVKAALKAGYKLDVFKKLGLTGTSAQGRDYDRFRGRVIFPILNTAGKVIAFGGRDLKGGLAKYINSPESELYRKSNELYGIFQAKSSIVSEDKCFLVEGYMDVIGMWQSGMRNVVASSGTALTDGQIALIHRFTQNITLIYDGDNAGIKASLRGIDMLLSHKMNVKVLLLPDGHDPDSFARKNTPDEFKKYVQEHETDIIRYKARVMLEGIEKDPHNRINAINSVVESIAHIPDPISRDVYIQECSLLMGIPDTTIARSVHNARSALIEKIKRERYYKDASRQMQPSQQLQQTAQSQYPRQSGNTEESQTTSPQTQPAISRNTPNPLREVEKAAIRLCLRHGYSFFCNIEEADGNNGQLDVLGYIKEELDADGIEFTTPIYKRLYEELLAMRPSFERAKENEIRKLSEESERIRRQGYQEISTKDLSVAEIKREEQKTEHQAEEFFNKNLAEWIRDYPGRILGSHEDEEIRNETMLLVFQRHQLSRVFLKDKGGEEDEVKLDILAPRTVMEWRNEIINRRIKDLMKTLQEVSATGDHEKEQELQLELSNLMAIRGQLAKNIGERIVFGKI
ncbi:MAG: DNA primase [Candidatus Amulumruptor caecigallinarius]|nr:DNA primase [Candidatus Amulumruptor caecigallinarius]